MQSGPVNDLRQGQKKRTLRNGFVTNLALVTLDIVQTSANEARKDTIDAALRFGPMPGGPKGQCLNAFSDFQKLS